MADDPTESDERLTEVLAELVELRRTLQRVVEQNQELLEQLRERNRRIEQLEEELEKMRRANKRQAAPFRRAPEKRKPKAQHKPPGRKTGHKGSWRTRPEPDEVDHHHRVELDGCPQCGGDELGEPEAVEQYVEDIEMRRVVHRIVTYRADCADCGRVHSRHPLQVSEACGAAGTSVGPAALSLAIDLNKRLGMSARKTCEVLDAHAGLSLSPGGLTAACHRLAGRLRPNYEGLIEALRDSAAIYIDETSWWVDEPGWWLWGATDDDQTTVYAVRPKRNAAVVHELVGPDFEGILSSDCLNIYDDLPYSQNKCYAHHLRAVRDARRRCPDSAYLREIELLLRSALAARAVDGPRRTDLVEALEKWARRLLADEREEALEDKIRNRLRKQREHLFTFLRHPQVDATNNAAERALRPAVIARKISCGNRTERGARTWEVLASLARSCDQSENNNSFHTLIEQAVRLHATQQPNSPPH